ncbi:MAG: hypothetical protein QXG00_05460, partial [Candidatus Woesearchaeota archaeon]
MNSTFFSYSFGCRVNEAEKQEIDRQMLKKGYLFTNNNPNIYIINSCAVTQKAEREVRQYVYQVRKKYPNSYIVITGCSATYWKKNNQADNLPVNLIVDNINKEFLIELIEKNLMK